MKKSDSCITIEKMRMILYARLIVKDAPILLNVCQPNCCFTKVNAGVQLDPRSHAHLEQPPGQESGDNQGQAVERERRDFEARALSPVHGQQVHAACAVRSQTSEVAVELVGAEELVASPRGGEHVRQEGGDAVREEVSDRETSAYMLRKTDMCGGDSFKMATSDMPRTQTWKPMNTRS